MENLKKGFIPVMLTPFKESGSVDYDALAKLTAYYIKAGAAGLFANCLSSEMYELDAAERMNIVKTVVKAADSAVPVVATGTFGNTIIEKADFVKKIYDTGVRAVIGITSLFAEENDPDTIFYDNVMKLFLLTEGIPMGLYECPVPYKRVVSPEQLGAFVATGRLTYFKDTCLDIEMIKQKINATQGQNFGLYDAYMGHAVASLKAGAAGLSCIQGNFFPELIVWLCNNYNNAALAEKVEHVQQFFSNNLEVMHHVYPVTAKYYLHQQGVSISTYTRRKDYGTLDSKVKAAIDRLSKDYTNLKEKLALRFVKITA